MNTIGRDPLRLTRRSAAVAMVLLGPFAMVPVQATAAMGMPLEVNLLLGFVKDSGCDFQRNGSWHTAHEAQVHLRDKFNDLNARNRLETAEQFIEKAASESSLTGRPYMVRCNGGSLISSNRWLSDELLRLRKAQ